MKAKAPRNPYAMATRQMGKKIVPAKKGKGSFNKKKSRQDKSWRD